MKKFINVLAIATLFIAMVGCKKDSTPTYTVTVNVAVDSTYPVGRDLPVFTVKMTNTAGAETVEAQTENGVAVFKGVLSGVYSFIASATEVIGDYTFNLSASAENKSVLKDETVNMTAVAVKSSVLVFKEIYQSGCMIGSSDDDSYFRDQYYEIYNNGEETVYADGLCFADCNKIYNYNYSAKFEFEDSASNPVDLNKNLIAQVVWQIPGEGTKYPVKPGESIIVCQLGQNHSDTLGKKLSPVNLLGAEFEAVKGEQTLWSGIVLHDGPAVNMSAIFEPYSIPQWLTSVGNAAMVMFKPSESLKSVYTKGSRSKYSMYCAIEIEDVIDAVNIIDSEARVTAQTIVLPAVLDAGYIWHSAPGSYTGESISRKAAGTTSLGTVKYQDTNNTKEDFVLNSKPEIRRNGAKVPSWNTWIN